MRRRTAVSRATAIAIAIAANMSVDRLTSGVAADQHRDDVPDPCPLIRPPTSASSSRVRSDSVRTRSAALRAAADPWAATLVELPVALALGAGHVVLEFTRRPGLVALGEALEEVRDAGAESHPASD